MRATILKTNNRTIFFKYLMCTLIDLESLHNKLNYCEIIRIEEALKIRKKHCPTNCLNLMPIKIFKRKLCNQSSFQSCLFLTDVKSNRTYCDAHRASLYLFISLDTTICLFEVSKKYSICLSCTHRLYGRNVRQPLNFNMNVSIITAALQTEHHQLVSQLILKLFVAA